jgi:hypothetical protein
MITLNGNVVMFHMSLGKLMKGVEDTIARKLGVPKVIINRIQSREGIETELDDFMMLYGYSLKSKELCYIVGDESLDEDQWLKRLDSNLAAKGTEYLVQKAQLTGMSEEEFTSMLNTMKSVREKYQIVV